MKQNCTKTFPNKKFSGIPPPPPPAPPSGGCSCSTYVSVTTGFGNCEKDFKGKPICYVNEPSSCSDLKESSSTGKRYSWDACSGPPTPPQPPMSPTEDPPTPPLPPSIPPTPPPPPHTHIH